MFGITSYSTGSLDYTPHFYFLLTVPQTETNTHLKENIHNSRSQNGFLGTPLCQQSVENRNAKRESCRGGLAATLRKNLDEKVENYTNPNTSDTSCSVTVFWSSNLSRSYLSLRDEDQGSGWRLVRCLTAEGGDGGVAGTRKKKGKKPSIEESKEIKKELRIGRKRSKWRRDWDKKIGEKVNKNIECVRKGEKEREDEEGEEWKKRKIMRQERRKGKMESGEEQGRISWIKIWLWSGAAGQL